MSLEVWVSVAVVTSLSVLFLFMATLLRRVVPTNEVAIVQSSRATTSYGKDLAAGNTYYEFPSWLPLIGITKITLPVSVFDLDLVGYEAYDQGRLPFVVDVKAFFRIVDSNMAAQRVSNFQELHNQLKAVVQGAVRTILASSDIEHIMQGRSTFGEQFTKEVEGQLTQWGVTPVKNIELMDIRDGRDSKVIHNIMDKKKSFIEMESRTEVAKNHQAAEIAETLAGQNTAIKRQEAEQMVGLRKVESDKQVAIAQQESTQAIQEQAKLTKEKEMEVLKVQNVRKAEIEKEMAVIDANKQKETSILKAEGDLEATKRQSEGILVEGQAMAAADKARQLAPVEAQIVLAKEIGGNKEYQAYLLTIKQIEAGQVVGIEQAKALAAAEIKIIANSDSVPTGITKVGELFSSKGGVALGTMLDGFKNTETGKAIVDNLTQ